MCECGSMSGIWQRAWNRSFVRLSRVMVGALLSGVGLTIHRRELQRFLQVHAGAAPLPGDRIEEKKRRKCCPPGTCSAAGSGGKKCGTRDAIRGSVVVPPTTVDDRGP